MKNEKSVLTKNQTKTFDKVYTEAGTTYHIKATVRYDDQCGNGHNTFSITGEIDRKAKNGRWVDDCGGCIHEEIAKRFPALAPFIKWHLVSSDQPMYYIENTLYHALEHGPKMAHVFFDDPAHGVKAECVKYCTVEEALEMCLKPGNTFNYASGAGYRLEKDEKTTKVRNLDYARSSAVWPEATDAELTQEPEALKAALLARLPALMLEFRKAVESFGFTF